MRNIQKIRTTNSCSRGYVHYSEKAYPKEWKDEDPSEGCPLCNRVFEIGDPIFMIITNNTFPNTLIHQSCAKPDLIIVTHELNKSYERFIEFQEKHKGWKWW